MFSAKYVLKLLSASIIVGVVLTSPAGAHDQNEWNRLSRTVEARRLQLEGLVREATQKGVCTDYAAVSLQVLSAFQLAAKHDRENVERVRRIFQTFGHYTKTDPTEADGLAFDELRACIAVADHAMTELRQQLEGAITLTLPPDFATGQLQMEAGYFRLDGRVVFPSSLVWMPKEESYLRAFGRIGEAYYTLGNLSEAGTVNDRVVERGAAALGGQCELNAAPLVFFLGHTPARWMELRHPEITAGARHFTRYDIDNPLIRQWIETLCAGVLPEWSAVCGERLQAHLLTNEPHFATRKGGWLAQNGVSEHTMAKYRQWIAAKYESVAALNAAYGTSYAALEDVTVELPLAPSLRGGPVWYDWCRFNMDRVNDWFAFLKHQVQTNDRSAAPVTIKMLGFTLSRNQRDGGMDIEYLTKLQDMPGADLRVVPRGATFYGRHEEGLAPTTGWQSRYAYDWVEQSMYLDFTKSLCPNKPFYDSEWHGFGAVSWRHFRLERDYVRSALWLAFTHGMGAIKPWLWGRGSDGSLRASADHIGELATQPIAVDAYGRTLKELNAHAERVVAAVPTERIFLIYYCEEAAIQDPSYTGHFKDIYEALKLLNLPVGFTTPAEVAKLEASRQTLIVPPTSFIADGSLTPIATFQQLGGRVVLVGPEQSFRRNEMGAQRSTNVLAKPFASLPIQEVLPLTAALDAVLAPVAPAPLIDLEIMDADGGKAYGVIACAMQDPESEGLLVLLNNVSKDSRVVRISPHEETDAGFVDVLTRRQVPTELTLKPCDVAMVRQGE